MELRNLGSGVPGSVTVWIAALIVAAASMLALILGVNDRVGAVGTTATVQASIPTAGEYPVTDGAFTFQLSSPNLTGVPINISYSVAGEATPNVDYAALNGTATIPNGSSSVVVPVTMTGFRDEEPEGDEAVVVTLTGTDAPSVTLGSPSMATVTIWDEQTDDDGDGVSDPQELVDGTDRNDQNSYLDSDGDMIPDFQENQIADGDGNGDGIADALQANVITIYNYTTDTLVTFDISEPGRSFAGGFMMDETELIEPPTKLRFPVGLHQIWVTVPAAGDSATVRIIYHHTYDTSKWRMYGALDDGTFELFSGTATFTTETINGSPSTVATMTLVDGGVGDEDGMADGTIVDPHGPAVTVASTPTPPDDEIVPNAPNSGAPRGANMTGAVAGYAALLGLFIASLAGFVWDIRRDA